MNKIVYTNVEDLRTYESLPPNDFKEFFMAYFKYRKGDRVEVTDFTNPVTFALFNSYIPKLDKNEDTYNKKVNANRENGKKGGRPKKSALQEVKETEFDLPKIEDYNNGNIQENCQNLENENKADLSPSKPSVDAEYHQQVEMPSNGLKTGKEEILEEDIINILNDNNNMSNPTNVRIDMETGRYFTDEKVKEIREKVEKSNNKPLPVVEDNMPTWEEYFSDYKYIIKDIIECYNSGTSIAKKHQIPENFKTLFNNKGGQYYKDRVLKIIEHYTTQQTVA